MKPEISKIIVYGVKGLISLGSFFLLFFSIHKFTDAWGMTDKFWLIFPLCFLISICLIFLNILLWTKNNDGGVGLTK